MEDSVGDAASGADGAVARAAEMIVDRQRLHGVSLPDAVRMVRDDIRIMGGDESLVDRAAESLRNRAREIIELKSPGGVHDLEYERLIGDLRGMHWYAGPRPTDPMWPRVKERLRARGLHDDGMDDLDRASTKVVGHLSDPGVYGLKKKGLIVGYVQSGKTANYTATIAKAADAGYRFFIVLAGVHNGLRAQTQARLDADLVGDQTARWHVLTSRRADFGTVIRGDSVLSGDKRVLCVVKKNAARLRRLVKWLEAVPEDIRRRCPTLLIDDEADQATPNTKVAQDEMSTINRLTRDIFRLLPTGSYVGYTATPFANVFMDPRPEDELYPSDFIIDLPKPVGYLGAEDLFGRSALDDADDPDDGMDAVRQVTEAEADLLRAPAGPPADAPVPEGLANAIRWFLLATAARWVRGHNDHSSMLVHTSARVASHAAMRSLVERALDEMRAQPGRRLRRDLSRMWEREIERVPPADFGAPSIDSRDVVDQACEILGDVRVVVDNGQSEDRLDYSGDEAQTVIAVGGNTLSRGLTLEGLVVSYFVRRASTYDALLQMGRWFGFRPGYGDLARVWTTIELEQRFRFLAGVEEEIRREMRYLEGKGTPRDFALRIRAHPDMAITARSKMQLAREVQVSYGGRRFQTFVFRNDVDWLRGNIRATREFICRLRDSGLEPGRTRGSSWLFRDVPLEEIIRFLERYTVHEMHAQLQPDLTIAYLEKRTDQLVQRWRVAVVGGPRKPDHGRLDLGLPECVQLLNRSRLRTPDDPVNIKTLMSPMDRLIDVEPDAIEDLGLRGTPSEGDFRSARRDLAGGTGLLLVYPVAKDSAPRRGSRVRVPLGTPDHVIGMGIVFPEPVSVGGGFAEDEEIYIGLPDDVFAPVDVVESDLAGEEEVEALRTDTESDAVYEAADGSGNRGGVR